MTANNFDERRRVIRALVSLGWSASLIAAHTDMTEATVKNDLKLMGGVATLSPKRQKPSKVYAATFVYYVSHTREELVSVGTNDAVRKYLSIEELYAFLDCLETGFEALTRIYWDDDTAPYVKLAAQIADYDPLSIFRGAHPTGMFGNYQAAIKSARMTSPMNFQSAKTALTEIFGQTAERKFLMVGRIDGLQEAVADWIVTGKTLTPLEAHVLFELYGLNGRPQRTSREIGKEQGLSRLRIEQHGRNAISKLHKKHGAEAARYFETVGTLRENRRAAETRIEVLEATIAAMQRERAGIISASGADNDKALIEALAVRDRIDGALLNTYKRIDQIELSVRTKNCLQDMGVEFIGELVQYTEEEMLKTKNFGRKSLRELLEILVDLGLRFGMILPSELAAKFPRKPLPKHTV